MEPPSAPPTTTPPPPPITTTTPPPPPPTTITAPTYPDSLDSSPRSRTTDFDDTLPPSAKLRLLCSYGGHIVPRPHDKSLCYVGGDTRIVVVDRTSTLSDLLSRLSKTLLNSRPFTLKYQLPNEDLDSLITVSTEEDLDNMIDEYDRLISTSNPAKPGRIRLFLFPSKPEGASSIGSILDGSNRSEDWFLNALNGAGALQRGFSDPASVNSLLGLDDGGLSKGVKNQNQNQEIHSVPDSPIVETSSSFGSTSSSPSLANLPPIRVHVEPRVGIEDQFGNLGIGVQKQVDEGFVVVNSPKGNLAPATAVMSGVPMGGGGGGVYSDDERSDHGGYRKQQQQQTMGQPVVMPTQTQLKQMSGGGAGGELPSPDSVSSDSSLSNAMARQKPVYQDPVSQLSSGSSRIPPNLIDQNTRIQLQQVSETGYALPPQFEQHQQQLLQQQIQQQHMQQQQQQQQQQQHHQQQLGQTQPLPQPQQYIPAGAHFVHHTPTGAVPLSTYYQMYPPQQSHHHPQYPVYYVPAGQSQAYSLPVQQPNMGETATAVPSSRPQTPPNPTMITPSSAYNQARNVPAPKPDMSGVYRTAAGPQLVQVPSSQSQPQSQSQSQPQAQPQAPPPQQQQQFMGYSQIHHPSQSIAPTSAANAGYAFEFADPAHAQVYYTQPLPPNLAAQYQAMNPGTTMVMPDGSSQHGSDNLKQQQIRSSQPL